MRTKRPSLSDFFTFRFGLQNYRMRFLFVGVVVFLLLLFLYIRGFMTGGAFVHSSRVQVTFKFFVQLLASATYSHTGIEAAMTPCGIGGSHRNASMHGAFRQGRTLLDGFWSERLYVRPMVSKTTHNSFPPTTTKTTPSVT